MQVRLVAGSYSSRGRVEIFCNDQWGTACINGFGSNEATTICRQLGYTDYSNYISNFR